MLIELPFAFIVTIPKSECAWREGGRGECTKVRKMNDSTMAVSPLVKSFMILCYSERRVEFKRFALLNFRAIEM